ncbi:MAG TPA: glutathione S-transferase family protein [Polyangiaceae bacterium]|nr:glutathione S-transferase family protein [Polyangiaceae bacterium]
MMRLVVGNLNYSSWSMRPWLALRHAGAEFRTHDIGMRVDEQWRDRILAFSGAGKVPILIDGSLSVHESLAICEYVAERFPEARLWPEDARLRARGRAISCEMLSGFSALRGRMNCNLRARASERPGPEPALDADIARVFDIWTASLETSSGEFLLGDFSIADCMYFPVASRFRTYGVQLPERLQRYSQALFDLPAVRELEGIAQTQPAIPLYDEYLSRRD